ncbi:hypothetical protein L1049_001890 [Liquidambar formosana]|uniref:Uncharacterized protein n=1 Tax=Liquidambar formosana TaxID=63359 RepID=A0AAP0R6Z0_LIQFO
MEGSLGVRKGAWTKEEDVLLRKCVENFGEGKWHLVPLRAGLNRCRKSCRLRWLNYLRPNIKRGEFALDEVDLIIRLHKLLGLEQLKECIPRNYGRWSLIAARLPGRTANDVKNYWNTHFYKKNMVSPQHQMKGPSSTLAPPDEDGIPWWESLLFEEEVDKGITSSVGGLSGLWAEKDINAPTTEAAGDTFVEGSYSGWHGFSTDVDLWDLLGEE